MSMNLQQFAKRILELLQIDGTSEIELRLERLKDGSVRIVREAL